MQALLLASRYKAAPSLSSLRDSYSHTVNDAHGDAAFEDNIKQYNKEFLYNPKVVAEVEHRKVTNRYAPYNEEHKRVLKRMPGKKAIAECKRRALILARGLYLALDGK